MKQEERQTGEIVLYQPDETIRLEVRVENETIWLTQAQMAELFYVKEHTITYHIKDIYKTEELGKEGTARKIRVVRKEGHRYVNRNIDFYNLDMIISVGYKVNSKRGVKFRQWATNVLKEYIIRGYSVNQRFEQLEQTVNKQGREIAEIRNKVDFFVQTSLPPQQGIFFDGQVFDAYRFASDLIRKADRRIVLIDNYVDDTVLSLLDKRKEGVSATIYTKSITDQFQLDIKRHNEQYASIEVRCFNKAHDRFLLIDDDVYHVGASIKDLGKKWFAFALMKDIIADDFIRRME
ncbi:MAG: virulence RhuM family protein [Succinivibrionaceae bacterium]|nr:virulence RhuM family protein [Succinivibrionaceae bacterium]